MFGTIFILPILHNALFVVGSIGFLVFKINIQSLVSLPT